MPTEVAAAVVFLDLESAIFMASAGVDHYESPVLIRSLT